MYPKRKADFSEVPEDKRLRADLADLFLSNQVAATRAGGLFKNAMASHATNVEDLAAVGEKSKQGIRNRGLTRRLLKGHHWPKTYLLSGLNPDTQEEQTVQIPLWLPHEMLSVLVEKVSSSKGIFDFHQLDSVDMHRMHSCCSALGTTPETVCAIGLWGDGVPYNSDRTKSIEVLSLNILSSSHKDLRIPICVIPKHWMIKQTTWSAVLSVVQWSLTYLAAGIFPGARHDGSPWHKGESKRAAQAGKPCPKAVLVQVRGDWSFHKSALHLPAWSLGCLFFLRRLLSFKEPPFKHIG